MKRTKEQIIDFNKKANNYAIRKGHRQISEDFASWATIKFIEGRKARIKDLYVDYLREEYGDVRSISGLQKSNSRRFAKEYNDGEHKRFDIGYTGYERLFVRSRTDDTSRACLILYFYWGLDENEIANCFGVTRARICQRIKRAQECLCKRIEKEESRETERDLEKILQQKNERRQWLEQKTFEEMEGRESREAKEYFRQSFEEWLT